MDYEGVLKELHSVFSHDPVWIVGTGTSMTLDVRFGMPALREQLLNNFSPNIDEKDQLANDSWSLIKQQLDEGCDVEAAMSGKDIPESLLLEIAKETGSFVANIDRETKLSILNNAVQPPLQRLLSALFPFDRPGTHLDIVTTNYDCVIEHTLDRLKLPVCTGFIGLLRKSFDWKTAVSVFHKVRNINTTRTARTISIPEPHVRLYKPHGSLDWFNVGDEVVSDYSVMYEEGMLAKRQVIAPGSNKYEASFGMVHQDMMSMLTTIFGKARAFFIIGFGFNDAHIQRKVVEERLKNNKMPGIILTRTLSLSAKAVLDQCKQVWAIYKDGNDTVIQQGSNVILKLENNEFWNITNFANALFGEE